jgi:transcriptional regulator with XRE-family HTH domain
MKNQPKTDVMNVKIAVALRAGRTAIGWNQQEFADKLDVAKSTIARVETMESVASATLLMNALHVLKEAGVVVDLLSDEALQFHVEPKALMEAAERLQDEQMRRSDRRKDKGLADKR